MSASAALLNEVDKVRPPYNINVLTQAAAEFVLAHSDVLDAQASQLRDERSRVRDALSAMAGVEVFPSAANFLLLRINRPGLDAGQVHARLLEQKVLVKNVGKMHALLHNCLRVTVSTPEENTLFLNALKAALAP